MESCGSIVSKENINVCAMHYVYTAPDNLTNQETEIINKSLQFLSVEYLFRIADIVNRKSKISLWIIDFFLTSFMCRHNVCYPVDIKEFGQINFHARSEYELQLNRYGRKYFDPFCRFCSIPFTLMNANLECTHIKLSIGQLNLFRWAFQNKVIDYIEEHLQEIVHDQHERIGCARKLTSIATHPTNPSGTNIATIHPTNPSGTRWDWFRGYIPECLVSCLPHST